MRRAAKVDTTHEAIRDALRAASVSVVSLAAIGSGVPDLLCSYRGFTALVECKTGKSGLRDSQRKFLTGWQGLVVVSNDPADAVAKFFQAYGISILRKL